MPTARLPKILFLLLVAAAAMQTWIYYPRLPDPVASHFGADGQPNGWQPLPVFFAFYAGAILLAAGLGFAAPKLISAMPASMINLPNKEYWLAPERRAETSAYFENNFAWMSCGLVFLEFTVFELAIRANLEPPHRFASGAFAAILAGFLLLAIVSTVRLISHFSKMPSQTASGKQ